MALSPRSDSRPCPARLASNHRMADVARALQGIQGIDSELVPGPFRESDKQLLVKLANGIELSVLPDIDAPLLYELVRMDSTPPEMADKLTLEGVVERVRQYVAGASNAGR